MGFLTGKRVLILGLLSDRSIAYGIASAMKREGAELAFTYQMEKHDERVKKLAQDFNSNIVLPCDVSSDEQIDNLFPLLKKHWDKLDVIVHSLAFVTKEALKGDFVEATTRENFRVAHDISSYSFTALAKAALPMLSEHASLLTLSYLGAERTMPNYNVMGLAKASLEANVRYMASALGPKGIRVNGIAPGWVATPGNAATGRMEEAAKSIPIGRVAQPSEIAEWVWLLSDPTKAGFVDGETIVISGADVMR